MSTDSGPQTRLIAGRYALDEVLGRGGMGTVWLATDTVLERQVALKELTYPVHLDDHERAVLRERTMREARAAAQLDHPHVVHVFDVVEQGGEPWLVMEHVAARSLQRVIEEDGPLSPAAVATIGLDVLAALGAAHAAGIVHRDVKPANVLVDEHGRACLTDFGIATTTGDSSLTTDGAFIGSPSYMAPERARGEQPAPPVDLWSLGATLYTAVEGRPPFDRGEGMATLMSVVSDHPAPAVRAGPLAPVLQGLLSKDPAARSTAEQVRRELELVARGQAPAGPPPPPAPAPRGPVPGDAVERIGSEDLRALASASRAVLGSVVRDARDQARSMQDRRRSRRRVAASPPSRPRRRRLRRRWVVVPVVVTLVVLVLVLVGAAVALAAFLGFF